MMQLGFFRIIALLAVIVSFSGVRPASAQVSQGVQKFTQREKEAMIRMAQRYLNALIPSVLPPEDQQLIDKKSVMEKIQTWKSPTDIAKNKELIEVWQEVGKRSLERHEDKLKTVFENYLMANAEAKANGKRVVMTGLLRSGNDLCKKIKDLGGKPPTYTITQNGKEVQIPLCK